MKTLLTTLAVAAFAVAAPAVAQNARLGFSDLDVSTPAGRAELGTRIDNAARQFCTGQRTTGSRMVSRECVEDATTEIVEKLPAHLRQAYLAHRAEGGRS